MSFHEGSEYQTRLEQQKKEKKEQRVKCRNNAGRDGCQNNAVRGEFCQSCFAQEHSENPNKNSKSPVHHPSHYNQGKFEVIDVIEDWKLGFCLGNAVKYIARADHKAKPVEDLEKALWYLKREIEERKNK